MIYLLFDANEPVKIFAQYSKIECTIGLGVDCFVKGVSVHDPLETANQWSLDYPKHSKLHTRNKHFAWKPSLSNA